LKEQTDAGSGITRGLRKGVKIYGKGPTGHTRPHSEKSQEIIVNPNVDVHTKTQNHQKTLRKLQKKTY